MIFKIPIFNYLFISKVNFGNFDIYSWVAINACGISRTIVWATMSNYNPTMAMNQTEPFLAHYEPVLRNL